MNQTYTIRLARSLDDVQQLRNFWECNQWHPGADYEFFQLILNSRQGECTPCVFVISRGANVVALLCARLEQSKMPIRLGYASLASFNIRKLVLIEGGFIGNRSEDIWEYALRFIANYISEQSIDLVLIENVSLNSPQHISALNLFGRFRLRPAHRPANHWLLQLPKSFEDFMAQRSKKRRYWLNRLPRVLDKEFPSSWRIIHYTSESDAGAFATAAESVAKQTYHRGLGVGFHDNPETRSRLGMEADRNQLHGYVLFIESKPIAFWHCFKYKTTLFLASTGYDPAYSKYEAGTVVLLKILETICGTEVQTVDFGLGDAEYKQRFGTEHFAETSLSLYSNSLRALAVNTFSYLGDSVSSLCRATLDFLKLTQRVKKCWRRGKSTKSHEQQESVSQDTHSAN